MNTWPVKQVPFYARNDEMLIQRNLMDTVNSHIVTVKLQFLGIGLWGFFFLNIGNSFKVDSFIHIHICVYIKKIFF